MSIKKGTTLRGVRKTRGIMRIKCDVLYSPLPGPLTYQLAWAKRPWLTLYQAHPSYLLIRRVTQE